jgi:alpha-ribazole phosphatase
VAAVHRAIVAAGEDAAIVSHGGPLKLLRALLRGGTPDLLAPAPAIGSVELVVVQPPAIQPPAATAPRIR